MPREKLQISTDGEVENMWEVIESTSREKMQMSELMDTRQLRLPAKELFRTIQDLAESDPARHALLMERSI